MFIRDGRILARTRDHTPVQMLIDAGRIREEAAATHPDRNKLLQCLGGPRAPRVEPTAHARLAEDDVVLLCSDGFWGPLTQRQLLMGVLGKDLKKALPELMYARRDARRPALRQYLGAGGRSGRQGGRRRRWSR